MPTIPPVINGVAVEFAETVTNDVHERVVDALKHCIKVQIASGAALNKIYISSAFDSHKLPSRHMQKKAVDISRINGMKIAISYPADASVKAIVNAVQDTFESYQHRRENFGPHLKKKLGKDFAVPGHGDHIHISVD